MIALNNVIKIFNEPEQRIALINDAPCPEQNVVPLVVEANGRHDAKDYGATGFDPVDVNVQPPLQDITATENGEYTADGEHYGIRKAVVNVPSRYDEGYQNGYQEGYDYGVENAPPTPDPSLTQLVEGTLTELCNDNVTTFREYCFYGCRELKKVYFPLAKTVSYYGFANNISLHTAIFTRATSISGAAFYYCYRLVSLILGNDTRLVSLANKSAFSSACYHILGTVNATYNPDGKKDGYIYVPLSLVADYRVATNWATYASQIMPFVSTVEDLTDIDGTTYNHACIWNGGEDFTEYYYNGTTWEVFTR